MKPIRYTPMILLAAVLFLGAVFLWGASAFADEAKTLAKAVQDSQNRAGTADMNDKWGIEVTAIHTAAAGNMVDFRYKVLDADKAGALFEKKTRPMLIHQKTGKALEVPRTAKVGPLMSSYKPKQDRVYWMFFGNQSKLVRPGDLVTVVIGDMRLENLKVQ